MPRRKFKDSKDTRINRIKQIINSKRSIGRMDPDDLILEILKVLEETENFPSVGKYYTFIYSPKTPSIQYDSNPLVGVTEVLEWGFKGINFHWGEIRHYTWNEVVSDLHVVYPEELRDLRSLPYKRIRLNN
jgi:hypothetical protein